MVLGKTNDAFREEAKLTDEERAAKAQGQNNKRPGPVNKPIEPAPGRYVKERAV